MLSSLFPTKHVSLPINRIYAVPPECYSSFVWMMETCKCMDIDVDEITFTSTDTGVFLSAEGIVRVDERAARFLISDCWTPGRMNVYILLGPRRYCVYSDQASSSETDPMYPLGGLMSVNPEEEVGTMAEAMDGMCMSD